MDKHTAAAIHQFDQMTGSFHQAAEALAAFRKALVDHGFTEEGAESLAEILFAAAVITDE